MHSVPNERPFKTSGSARPSEPNNAIRQGMRHGCAETQEEGNDWDRVMVKLAVVES